MKGLIVCLVAALLQPVAGDGMCADMTTEHPSGRTDHFRVVSNAKKPSPEEIATDLEATWRTFRDLFGVEPAAVEVVITVTSGGGGSSADAGTESPAGGPAHRIAWTIAEGEPLDSQRFSDLSHEIAHIYFLEYMHAGGLHQAHAWLHEAVACHHEKEPSRRHRLQWMRDHLQERIPLATLFTMKNPVKQSPLVELTVQLHEKLVRGEITVDEAVDVLVGEQPVESRDAGAADEERDGQPGGSQATRVVAGVVGEPVQVVVDAPVSRDGRRLGRIPDVHGDRDHAHPLALPTA